MTQEEFLKQMKEWNIEPEFYNIDGPVRDFSLNLLKISDEEYTVFYMEKGDIVNRQIFFTYEDALDYLYQEVKRAYGFTTI